MDNILKVMARGGKVDVPLLEKGSIVLVPKVVTSQILFSLGQ